MKKSIPLDRREFLSITAAVGVGSLIGCSSSSSPSDAGLASDSSTSPADAGAADAQAPDAQSSDAQSVDSQTTDASTGWARGGTAALVGLASYPNPFTGAPNVCTPTCVMTEGPCHDNQAPEREDISEGQPGLPLRFGFQILDDACMPVANADIDVWHCDIQGLYSSRTVDNPAFCTDNNAAALAGQWFRGHRVTDANGIVWFSSCFPGWYPSRAIHIHFTIRRNGTEFLTSQVGFQWSLIQEITSAHQDYAAKGIPDTNNTSDSVFPAATVDQYMMETMRMNDGAMLAYKTIIVRSSTSTSICSAGGGMMPPR